MFLLPWFAALHGRKDFLMSGNAWIRFFVVVVLEKDKYGIQLHSIQKRVSIVWISSWIETVLLRFCFQLRIRFDIKKKFYGL